MQYVDELIDEFCRPYCTDERLLGIMESALKAAFSYAEQTNGEVHDPEQSLQAYKRLFKIVQCANRDAMEEAEAVPYEQNWQTPYPDLWSPYLDFTDTSINLADTDRKVYSDDLSVATLEQFPWLKEPYKFTPIETAVVVYDIWLQTILSWEHPYEALQCLYEESPI